jgi:hypothetical protein
VSQLYRYPNGTPRAGLRCPLILGPEVRRGIDESRGFDRTVSHRDEVKGDPHGPPRLRDGAGIAGFDVLAMRRRRMDSSPGRQPGKLSHRLILARSMLCAWP